MRGEMCGGEAECAKVRRNVQVWGEMCGGQAKCAKVRRHLYVWSEMCRGEAKCVGVGRNARGRGMNVDLERQIQIRGRPRKAVFRRLSCQRLQA